MFANYARYYELFNQDKDYKKEIDFIYKWAEKPEWIFDIGCGAGNYWKYYPKKTKIFGVDESKDMLQFADDKRCIGKVCADISSYVHSGRFECATALFDVINYIPGHAWWKNIPIDKGYFLIFDIWDKEKVVRDGFKKTVKEVNGIKRTITPLEYDGKTVTLEIEINDDGMIFQEHHKMYVYSYAQIETFCGNDFKIVDTKAGKGWQKWYKLRKKEKLTQ